MALLYLYFNGVVGSVLWIFSTEAHAAAFGAEGWNPLLVGLVCAAGQNTTYVLLYLFGRELMVRWSVLRRMVARVHSRFGSRLDRAFPHLTALGCLVGVPPAVGMVLLAPGFGMRLRTVLLITFPTRFLRFALLATAGDSVWATLQSWWGVG